MASRREVLDINADYPERAVAAGREDHPETNALVALDHVATKSNTPVSKAIVIRLERAWAG